jgi:hypothetical protein
MDTKLTQRWHDRHAFTTHDQHPGCHTHASGFDYVALYTEADKRIDAMWQRQEQQARLRLVQVLANRASKKV